MHLISFRSNKYIYNLCIYKIFFGIAVFTLLLVALRHGVFEVTLSVSIKIQRCYKLVKGSTYLLFIDIYLDKFCTSM